jgi:colicin import membrane protein
MAKTQKQEIVVIDFTKFSVAQLPELQGKKEEIASIIEANPIVEIIDNPTYELAKKSRTSVKTLRTGLQKEQTDVRKRIKEHVLDVVDAEYDTLVLGVKSAEQSRQEPITIWEDKKEQERLEKARLEELRVKQIKEAIQTFKDAWIENVDRLLYEGADNFFNFFEEYLTKFKRSQLAEFEVLFDDAISVIRQLAEFKIKTLREQEQIRVDNLMIKEKNADNTKISNFSHEWNSNIDSLKTFDIEDVKEAFKRDKIMGLKHFQSNFDEVYTALEKRLNSQIEFISFQERQRLEQAEIAENNRIAQEKFLAEKKEFEEKQAKQDAEIKKQQNEQFEVRKNRLAEIGFKWIGHIQDFVNSELELDLDGDTIANADASNFEKILLNAKKLVEDAKKQKEIAEKQEVVFEDVSQELNHVDPRDILPLGVADKIGDFIDNNSFVSNVFNDQEEDVHEVATEKPIQKETTWAIIYLKWLGIGQDQDFFDWLSENYNVPTKK